MGTFPEGFVWGAATSSYQIEGAASADGKGKSIWDHFCRIPGAVYSGHTGESACEHYYRYKEDVALMKAIGLRAYRMSLSWPRIIPAGRGAVNEAGLAFYDRLIDTLLEAGIIPYITLFHWDLPLQLQYRGGWMNRESVEWFAEYAAVCVKRFSDRVEQWITLNEPQVFIGEGYQAGTHAPGVKAPFADVLSAAHNAMMAHGKAVQAIRANSARKCRIGYAVATNIAIPADGSEKSIDAARAATFEVKIKKTWVNAWWLDPVILGRYPEDGLRSYAGDLPEIAAADIALISQPIDYIGMNVYFASKVCSGANGEPEHVPFPRGYPMTAFGWNVVPESLRWGPYFFWERYRKPVMITENGISCHDWIALDGKVHDAGRIDFTARHLIELGKAINDGAKAEGYFHWSLMDNFEWSQGYKQRFGLIYVDYETQKRTLKDSAYWYRGVIESNGGTVGPATGPDVSFAANRAARSRG